MKSLEFMLFNYSRHHKCARELESGTESEVTFTWTLFKT